MASTGRRSEDGGESSYDRDSSSHQHYQHQRRRQPQMQPQIQPQMPQQQYHGQSHPHSSYPHDQLQHGKMQNQYPPGNTANTNGKYNISSTVPVPPRMRLRKWSDMTRTIWHYERIEQIGEGTYGQVYRARCKDTNEIVAMKKIRVHHGAHWGMPPTVIREIKILKRLVHPNLVRMIEVVSSKGMEHLDADDYHKGSDRSRKKNKHKTGGGQGAAAENNGKDNKNSTKNDTSNNSNSKQIDISDAREGYKGNLFLVLEYVPHDLTGLLDVAYKFSEVEIKCVFRQLLEALRYMHDQKYVHRDIKSSNILIDRNFRLKLADFGLARSIEPPLLDNLHDRGSSQEFTNKVITLWYRPPELLLGATRYGFAVDIWSAGCILAELVLGRPLFTGKTEMDQLQLIFDMVGTPTSKSWPGVRDLKLLRTGDVTIDGDSNRKRPKLRERYETKMNNIAPGAIKLVEKLLELDPSKRPTASRALSHRYFSQGPQAPDLPEELGEMKLAEGGSFHEFQTKKKRKEAKAQAEKIKQAALDGGHTTKQAQEEFDACYRGIMEKVAQEGLAPSAVANSSNQTNDIGTGRDRSKKAVEGNSREAQNEKSADAKERDNGDKEDRHRGKHRSSRSDRSPEHRTSGSRATREKEYRESSSRGRERRPRDRSDTGNSSSRHENARERSRDKNEKEKSRDGSSSFPGTSKEAESSHRDRDHGKERSRSSRRASESEDRRKKRRREDDTERSSHSKRERDKERQREHRKASKVESGSNSNESKSKSENNSEEIISSSVHNKEENKSREGVATDENLHKESMGKGDSSKPIIAADSERNDKTEKTAVEKPQSLQDENKNTHSKDANAIVGKPDETEEPKLDMEKQSGNEHHSRSTSSRGDKKRSDRSRDRSRDDDARKDRRDRDRDQHHRRRSSKEKDGRSREGDRDRASSGRSSSNTKKRKSRNRSRSPDRDGSPGRSRDDRHHRHRRDRDHSRHERDRERRHHQDDLRDLERRPRNDRYHHHDDWGPRGHPPAIQRRGGDFGGNPDFGGPQHNRRDFPPRGGDPGMYGGGDWGPRGDGRGGGPGDFRGPPSRHPGPPHGGRPMDYYPPGGDHPPPGYRDRERGPRRDRDRR